MRSDSNRDGDGCICLSSIKSSFFMGRGLFCSLISRSGSGCNLLPQKYYQKKWQHLQVQGLSSKGEARRLKAQNAQGRMPRSSPLPPLSPPCCVCSSYRKTRLAPENTPKSNTYTPIQRNGYLCLYPHFLFSKSTPIRAYPAISLNEST